MSRTIYLILTYEVIELRYFEGYSLEETATLLQRTSGAVRGSLDRAKKKIRESLASIAETYAVSITNIQAIPHDLWPAGQLPRLGLVEQVTLIAAGFDLTFRMDANGKTVTLIPIPATVD